MGAFEGFMNDARAFSVSFTPESFKELMDCLNLQTEMSFTEFVQGIQACIFFIDPDPFAPYQTRLASWLTMFAAKALHKMWHTRLLEQSRNDRTYELARVLYLELCRVLNIAPELQDENDSQKLLKVGELGDDDDEKREKKDKKKDKSEKKDKRKKK